MLGDLTVIFDGYHTLLRRSRAIDLTKKEGGTRSPCDFMAHHSTALIGVLVFCISHTKANKCCNVIP